MDAFPRKYGPGGPQLSKVAGPSILPILSSPSVDSPCKEVPNRIDHLLHPRETDFSLVAGHLCPLPKSLVALTYMLRTPTTQQLNVALLQLFDLGSESVLILNFFFAFFLSKLFGYVREVFRLIYRPMQHCTPCLHCKPLD